MARDPDPQPPFRWNIASRPELGGLPDAVEPASSDWLLDELRQTLAGILGLGDGGDLVFLGRSPELIFDLGRSLLADTGWRDRLRHLQMSLNTNEAQHLLRHENPGRQFMRGHLAAAGLSPQALLASPNPIALVDVVDVGGTFGSLVTLLRDWTVEERLSWRDASRKLRLVGLVFRGKPSPKAWRWQQHATWLDLLPSGACKNLSLHGYLWRYLAVVGCKTTPPYGPDRWDGDEAASPNRHADHLRGLAEARWLYERGASREQRLLLAEDMARLPAMRRAWFRSLAGELRRPGA
ncbi:MAG TPA: hypothetical protein VGE07_21445 [Herpetosiphonaceae bacterium]